MELRKLILSVFKIVAIFAIVFWQPTNVHAQVVATVGSRKITLQDFKRRFDIVKEAPNAPPPELFLEDLVRFEVGVQEAKKRDLEKDPDVRERIEQVLYQGLIEKELGKKAESIKVSEEEMKRHYQNNPEIRLSHILIEFKPESGDKEKAIARKRAQEIYEEVKNSKRPFEELVKLYTDDPLSKNTGGDIGWQTKISIVPNVYQTALNMKVGEIKGLVPTRWGFHIIKLTGKNSYLQANKKQIRAAVFEDKRKQMFDSLFDQLKKKYKIQTNPDLIRGTQ